MNGEDDIRAAIKWMKLAGRLRICFTSPVDEDLLPCSQLFSWQGGIGGRLVEQGVVVFTNFVGDDLLSAQRAFSKVRCNVRSVDIIKN